MKRSFPFYGVLGLIASTHAFAAAIVPITLEDMTTRASRIFRGQCLSADVGTIEVAGAEIPVTTYTFQLSEYLKGTGPFTIVFRQVGTPEGELRDLGLLVGLPVYAPATEYVLFLLPESSAGLTSPAGAGQGAFVVNGGEVFGVIGGPGVLGTQAPSDKTGDPETPTQKGGGMSYETLRSVVLQIVGE